MKTQAEMIEQAKTLEGWTSHWNGNEFELYATGQGWNGDDWVGELNMQEELAEFIHQSPALILKQAKQIEGLLQDKHDLQTLVKIIQLGADDLAETLAELANSVLGYTTLPASLLEQAQLAKELVGEE